MGISQAQFARKRGVTKMAVSTWKDKGLLVFDADGKIDEEASNARLDERPESYRGGKSNRKPVEIEPDQPATADESLKDQARALLEGGHIPLLTHSEATALKENYAARLNQLKYDKEAGTVVAIEDVQRILVPQLAAVRTRLLAIGASVAPRVALLKTAQEVKKVIDEEIAAVLQELTIDRSI